MRDRHFPTPEQYCRAPIAWYPSVFDRLTKVIDEFSLNTLDAIRASGFDEAVAHRAITEGREAIFIVLVSAIERRMIEDAAEAGDAH